MAESKKPAKKRDKASQADALNAKIEELTHALQTERADAINLRRRHEAEISGLKNHIKASLIHDLLPVIDNLERSLKHVPKDLEDNNYVKGIIGIINQFEKTLTDLGVQRIKTVGEEFDPKYHEAVSLEEGSGTKEVISQELQAGYKLNDQVIRHAMVKVKLQ